MSLYQQILMIILSQSSSLLIYEISIVVSFLIHRFYFLSFVKQYLPSRPWLSFYIFIVTLLASTDLLLNALDDYLSSILRHILLVVDGILTGALLALLSLIYSSLWLMWHGLLTLMLVIISKSSHWKSIEIFNPCLTDCLLITINLLHALYVLLNGVQTYMHRLVALSGMCMSFFVILFYDDQRILSMSSPIVIIHFVQSVRNFFLDSVVICIRNRTSYWQK